MVSVRAHHPRPVWVFDGALAAVLLATSAVELALADGVPVAGSALALLAVTPVACRRIMPVPTALAVAGAMTSSSLVGPGLETFSQFVALMAVTLALGDAGRVVGAVAALGVLWIGVAVNSDDLVADLAWSGLLMGMAWTAGRAVAGHKGRVASLRELTARLEREREMGARLAVVEERARLAGEVHDAVAHTVAGMLAQAEAAGVMLDRDPERARASLRAVQESGRESIDQLRVTLRVLRSEPPEPGPEPPQLSCCSLPAPPRRWPAGASTALVGGLAVLWMVEILWFPQPEHGPAVLSTLLAALAVTALAVRDRAPLAAAAVVSATSFADAALGATWNNSVSIVAAVMLAVYAIGAHPARRRAIAGGLVALALLLSDELIGGESDPIEAVTVTILFAIPWTAGWLARRHREQARELSELARELEREVRANARLAVLAERTHMARELHDTVAHGVSVMVVQAAAAEHASHADPDAARDAVDVIPRTGRDTLADLQRLLGLLDRDEHPAPRAPQPTLAELDALVGQVRRAGLPVSFRVEGTPAPIPPDIAGTAYRIVQEALTNVLKHAGTPPTAVVVRYLPGALDLAVDDDGPGPPAGADGGHGLIGMRERAALSGGELRAGSRAGGGYAVHARLPLQGGAR